MSILNKIPYGSMVGNIFVDSLTVTLPSVEGEKFLITFAPFAESLGFHKALEKNRGYEFFDMADDHTAVGGKFIFFSFVAAQRIFKIEAKGAFLDRLRLKGRYTEFLTMLSAYPHRVTRLDVTADFAHPASTFVRTLYRAASRGGLAFSRKEINPARCKMISTISPTSGKVTGCVYLANGADVSAKVYDKQAERMDKAGIAIPDRTRVEITLNRGAGATLRDASLPAHAFQHFAGKFLVDCPPVEPWVPHSLGFDMAPLVPRSLHDRVDFLASSSTDIQRLSELLVELHRDTDKALAHLRILLRPALDYALKVRLAA